MDGQSLYAYVSGNPLVYFDPFGLSRLGFWDYVKGAGALISEGAQKTARTVQAVRSDPVGSAAAAVDAVKTSVTDTVDTIQTRSAEVYDGNTFVAAAATLTGMHNMAEGIEGFDTDSGRELSGTERVTQIAEGVSTITGAAGAAAKAAQVGNKGLNTAAGAVDDAAEAGAAARATDAVTGDGWPTFTNPRTGQPDATVEVLFQKDITGTRRDQHRNQGNADFAESLRNDPLLNQHISNHLGVDDALAHMESGKSGLLNPPGTQWHHPNDNANAVQLMRTGVHREPAVQFKLHPEGKGGFANHFGSPPASCTR